MAYDRIFQLRIALLAIEPPIWRRIQIPGTMTLPRVHRVFQVVMGWTDSHLHEFVVRGQRYGQMSREGGPFDRWISDGIRTPSICSYTPPGVIRRRRSGSS